MLLDYPADRIIEVAARRFQYYIAVRMNYPPMVFRGLMKLIPIDSCNRLYSA